MDLIGISDLICLLPTLHKYPSAFIFFFPLPIAHYIFPGLGTWGFFWCFFFYSNFLPSVGEGPGGNEVIWGLPRNVLGQGGPWGGPSSSPPSQPRLITMEMTLCRAQPHFGSLFVPLLQLHTPKLLFLGTKTPIFLTHCWFVVGTSICLADTAWFKCPLWF